MKTILKTLSLTAIIALIAFSTVSCEKEEKMEMEKNIVEIAVNNPNFSILVQALVKADLASALQGDGPFTVFAPTNAAFQSLFTELGVTGIEQLSKEALTPILLYHVVSGKVTSGDLSTGYVNTLSTSFDTPMNFFVNLSGGVKLNGNVNVTQADLDATNGVIHIIDKVLVPPTVVDIAIANPNFSILVEAVVKAGLVETLSGTGPFTVFAPTNAAFQTLFTQLGVSGIDALSAEALTPILTYHVVSGNVRAAQVTSGNVPTVNGENITIAVGSGVTINGDTNVIATDVQGSNGVVHVIDKVLLPTAN